MLQGGGRNTWKLVTKWNVRAVGLVQGVSLKVELTCRIYKPTS